jgi:sugar lactone lactonase YvrE
MNTEMINRTRRIGVIEPGTRLAVMDDSPISTLGSTADVLEAPSGIALHEGVLYVTDNATSQISAWTLGGELIDTLTLDIDTGGLMGLTFDDQGRIYVVDAQTDRLLRISPRF